MKKFFSVAIFLLLVFGSNEIFAQEWIVGGRLGLSIGSGNGSTSAGLQIGPMGEVIFNKRIAVGSDFNINTQTGTPIEWSAYFKYYFDVKGSKIKPYANGGVGLWFMTGGPFFGIRFGGGAMFPVAKNLYIPADLQMGPVFASTSSPANNFFVQSVSQSRTFFYIALTSGIRYYF